MNGSEMIAAERQRQIDVERHSAEHDDEHETGDLAMAGACYALIAADPYRQPIRSIMTFWPWDERFWKPKTGHPGGRLHDLVKAGALIAAEIDRMIRLKDRE